MIILKMNRKKTLNILGLSFGGAFMYIFEILVIICSAILVWVTYNK